jgi:hypothetical protein
MMDDKSKRLKATLEHIAGLKLAVEICNEVYCTGSSSIDECTDKIEEEIKMVMLSTDSSSVKWVAPKSEPPLYQCHKQVRALRIRDIKNNVWQPDDDRYGLQEFDQSFMDKHKPHSGGYVIYYPDGYESFSPGEVFEAGYTLIEESDQMPWFRDNNRTRNCLSLVSDTKASMELIATWTDKQCQEAEEWALAVHLNASDNDDVVVPPRPVFIPQV